MAEILLDVRGLKTYFHTEEGVVKAVDGVDFSLKKGQTLGIVGESGCGKSVTSMSIMQLLPVPPAQYVAGSILFKGKDLLQLSGEEMRQIRGREISMIFQEPMTSLNPVYKVGDQIIEALLRQPGMDKASARQRAIELLEEVGISDAKLRVDNYPHQMSGGMKQRVMIAMALASQPDLLIADEPTTALDVTIQAQILDLMRSLQKKYHMSIMLITHDLGVVAEMADEVVVMYAGKVVERGDVETIFLRPRHPYTMGLFRSLPKLGEQKEVLDEIPGVVPNPLDFPQGCKFRTRCPFAVEKCFVEPSLEKVGEGHFASCWRLEEELEWPSELSAQRSAKPSDE
ncbi:MAG: ABC transporter ATP-binding protein [Planctomycetota bacterium]|nr:MAG: ABC transporter ATP-binding protein [Planctomycetota bacterium]